MKEIWKQIDEFPDYEVSNLGNVRSVTREVIDAKCTRIFERKVLKPWQDIHGYYHVSLRVNGETKKRSVHRLVAQAFIANPDNKPQVNHKDGNPKNNVVENLEWCTNAENTLHAYRTGLNTHKQKLITFNGKTQNITTWAKEIGIPFQTLARRLKDSWSIEKALTVKNGHYNRKDSRLITYKGKTQTVTQWAREKGLHQSTLDRRLKRGWSIERALNLRTN